MLVTDFMQQVACMDLFMNVECSVDIVDIDA